MKRTKKQFEVIPLTAIPKDVLSPEAEKSPKLQLKEAVRRKSQHGSAKLVRAVPKKAGA